MIDYQDRFSVKSVSNSNHLESFDVYSLTRLYMPIIGVDSYSLYMLLTTITKEAEIKILLDLLSFQSLKVLNQSLEKLEAVGLIKRYIKKHDDFNDYIFYINKPLSVEDFKKCRVLYEYLCGQIGKSSVDEIVEVKKISKTYKDISKSFDEVFETALFDIGDIYTEISNQKLNNLIHFKDEKFDYVLFKLSIENIVSSDVLNDNSFKQMITEIAFTYRLDEQNMVEVITNTINYDKEFTYELISKRAFELYKNKYSMNEVKLQTINNDMFTQSGLDDKTLKLFNILDSSSIVSVLQDLGGIVPAQSEINMFESIRKDTNYSSGVINFMALYYCKIHKGNIPSYNYFMKVANEWRRSGVNTLRDAHEYVMKSREKAKTTKNSFAPKVKQTPTWYSEYQEELKEMTAKKTEEVSSEEVFTKATNLFKKGN